MPKTTISDEDLEQTIRAASAEMGPVMEVEFPVDICLGSATMTVDQLLRLSPGDVVTLDRASSGYVEVNIGGVRIAEAEVIVRKRGSAARLVKIS